MSISHPTTEIIQRLHDRIQDSLQLLDFENAEFFLIQLQEISPEEKDVCLKGRALAAFQRGRFRQSCGLFEVLATNQQLSIPLQQLFITSLIYSNDLVRAKQLVCQWQQDTTFVNLPKQMALHRMRAQIALTEKMDADAANEIVIAVLLAMTNCNLISSIPREREAAESLLLSIACEYFDKYCADEDNRSLLLEKLTTHVPPSSHWVITLAVAPYPKDFIGRVNSGGTQPTSNDQSHDTKYRKIVQTLGQTSYGRQLLQINAFLRQSESESVLFIEEIIIPFPWNICPRALCARAREHIAFRIFEPAYNVLRLLFAHCRHLLPMWAFTDLVLCTLQLGDAPCALAVANYWRDSYGQTSIEQWARGCYYLLTTTMIVDGPSKLSTKIRLAFQEAITQDPQSRLARLFLGHFYSLQLQCDEALKEYEAATVLTLHPRSSWSVAESWHYSGRELAGSWRLKESLEKLQAAKDLWPEHPIIMNDYGVVAFHLNHWQKAENALLHALQLYNARAIASKRPEEDASILKWNVVLSQLRLLIEVSVGKEQMKPNTMVLSDKIMAVAKQWAGLCKTSSNVQGENKILLPLGSPMTLLPSIMKGTLKKETDEFVQLVDEFLSVTSFDRNAKDPSVLCLKIKDVWRRIDRVEAQ